MNTSNKDFLSSVKELSELLFVPKEIAIMLQVEPSEKFITKCRTEGTEEYKAYMGGRLEAEMMLRKSILTLAYNGSSPAQTMANNLLMDSRIKEIER